MAQIPEADGRRLHPVYQRAVGRPGRVADEIAGSVQTPPQGVRLDDDSEVGWCGELDFG